METPRRQSNPLQVKFKDSCDPCSISKVRCTKERPNCARCDKLGRKCQYSPARRIGRPKGPYSTQIKPSSVPAAADTRTPNRSHPANSATTQFNAPNAAGIGFRAHDQFATTHSVSDDDGAANCLHLLLDLLSDLEAQKTPYLVSAMTACLETSAKQISCVLICPCSLRQDVAFLAVAACNAMLNIVEAQREAFYGYYGPTSAKLVAPGAATDELRRMANLVAQLTSRYYGMQDGDLRETLLGLTGELRTRLQGSIERLTTQTAGLGWGV